MLLYKCLADWTWSRLAKFFKWWPRYTASRNCISFHAFIEMMLLNLFLCIATLTRTFKCALMLTPAFYNMQVSRDAETGISRGTAFVTMRSLAEARTAISALDGFVSHTTPQLQLQFLSLLSKMELLRSHIVNKCIFVARTNPSSYGYRSLTCTCMCFSLSGLRWAWNIC